MASGAGKNMVLRKIELLSQLVRSTERKGELLNTAAVLKAKDELLSSFEAEYRKLA